MVCILPKNSDQAHFWLRRPGHNIATNIGRCVPFDGVIKCTTFGNERMTVIYNSTAKKAHLQITGLEQTDEGNYSCSDRPNEGISKPLHIYSKF